jgi:hypothetical protein
MGSFRFVNFREGKRYRWRKRNRRRRRRRSR